MMSGYQKRHVVFKHQRDKRIAVIAHEAKMIHAFLDRSHYKRAELFARLAHARRALMWVKRNEPPYRIRQLRWEWQVAYVQLRMCFKPPLPWEANRYCRWV